MDIHHFFFFFFDGETRNRYIPTEIGVQQRESSPKKKKNRKQLKYKIT